MEWKTGEGFVCPDCWSRLKPFPKKTWSNDPSLQGRVMVVLSYDDLMRRIIHQMKFYGRKDIATRLGIETAHRLRSRIRALGEMTIIPVPLHRTRIRERGFDQNLVIAAKLAELTGLELRSDILERIRHTRPQSQLSNVERLSNLRGAFVIRSMERIKSIRRVLLVDDVIHTGATVKGCIEQLNRIGITDVIVIVACG